MLQRAKVTLKIILNIITSKCLALSICIGKYDDDNHREECEIDEFNINTLFGKAGYNYDIVCEGQDHKGNDEKDKNHPRWIGKKDLDVLIDEAQIIQSMMLLCALSVLM